MINLSSCITRKDITYFQTLDRSKIDTVNVNRETNDEASKLRTASYQAKIQEGDILNISISSLNPEATSLFTFQAAAKIGAVDQFANTLSVGFLVDGEGNIQLPILGGLNVKGKTTIEIRKEIELRLTKYLESPVVSVRFVNFKITLMGDVSRPGVYTFASERVSLFEALSTAGDLTIFGNRRTLQIIRDREGKNESIMFDLTDKDLLKTKYMFLHPNDILYVEPGKGKIASADNTYRILPMLLTGLNIIALLYYRLGK